MGDKVVRHMLYELTRCLMEKALAFGGTLSYTVLNTRAVPLVRKDDVHQGRVFYLPGWILLWGCP